MGDIWFFTQLVTAQVFCIISRIFYSFLTKLRDTNISQKGTTITKIFVPFKYLLYTYCEHENKFQTVYFEKSKQFSKLNNVPIQPST